LATVTNKRPSTAALRQPYRHCSPPDILLGDEVSLSLVLLIAAGPAQAETETVLE
jgi:hypothetical protein